MILLTDPYDPGDLDPGNSYTHAEVLEIFYNASAKFLRIRWLYGYLVDGAFTPGLVRPTLSTVTGEGFDDYTAIAIDGDATCTEAHDRAVQQTLIDQAIIAGSIV